MSVVIPAWRSAATLGGTLAALAEQQLGARFEVIVVVEPADPETAQVIEAAPLPVRAVEMEMPAAGARRNRGAAEASAPVLAFTDADCRPTPGWLDAALAALAGADLVQGAVFPPPDAQVGPFDRTLVVEGMTGMFETANLVVRRELFERLGGFEDPFGTQLTGGRPFGEDAWFGWRARRARARISFCREARVHHVVFPWGAGPFVKEHARRRYFPLLVRLIPELRESFCYRRLFLDRRTAALDLAVVGGATAVARRRAWPALLAAPYLKLLFDRARLAGRRGVPGKAAADAAADLVSLAALARGSVRARTLLL